MSDQIDIVSAMTEAECREMLRDMLSRLTDLTQVIKQKHPLIMGKGDSTWETAVRLIRECKCR